MIASVLDHQYIAEALAQAREAAAAGEVPVGAVIVCDGKVVARAQNRMRRDNSATSHAELLAIRLASVELNDARLDRGTLYITLEPCAMCAGAIVLARLQRVVFSAWDDKAGMAGSVGDVLRHHKLNHRPDVLGGVGAEPAAALLREFFASRRNTTADA